MESATGRMPLTRSCSPSRLEKVVLPEDEGPAISTSLTCVLAPADLIGDLGDLLLVQALGHADHLVGHAATVSSLSCPTVSTPRIWFHLRVSR